MIGENLRTIRKEKGITQKQLAKSLKLSKQVICNYEKNRRNPDIHTLVNIAKALDTTTDNLLGIKASKGKEVIEAENEAQRKKEEYNRKLRILKDITRQRLDGIIEYRDTIGQLLNTEEFIKLIRYIDYYIKFKEITMETYRGNVVIRPKNQSNTTDNVNAARITPPSKESDRILLKAICELLETMCRKVRIKIYERHIDSYISMQRAILFNKIITGLLEKDGDMSKST